LKEAPPGKAFTPICRLDYVITIQRVAAIDIDLTKC